MLHSSLSLSIHFSEVKDSVNCKVMAALVALQLFRLLASVLAQILAPVLARGQVVCTNCSKLTELYRGLEILAEEFAPVLAREF